MILVQGWAMTKLFFLVEAAPEGGYTDRALGQSIFTEADTLDDLSARTCEAGRTMSG